MTVGAAIVAGYVLITVEDTGIGIAPEHLQRVFQRFWQADSTVTRQHGGLGIGLALARHVVELHGGHIQAASAGPGAGTTITIVLPYAGAAQHVTQPAVA